MRHLSAKHLTRRQLLQLGAGAAAAAFSRPIELQGL